MSKLKSKCQHYTPMIYQQIWFHCRSIKDTDPKKYKAMFKDLMKLEQDKYYPVKMRKS